MNEELELAEKRAGEEEMKAFHGDTGIKEFYLDRVREHARLDQIAKGVYYKEDKEGNIRACGVGCTIHGSDHARYEKELGIPEWLAHVEDAIFEELPNKRARKAVPFVSKDSDTSVKGAWASIQRINLWRSKNKLNIKEVDYT